MASWKTADKKPRMEVAKLPDLESLYINSPNISDAGLSALKSLKKLTAPNIDGRTAATDAGFADLQKALPKLKITRSN